MVLLVHSFHTIIYPYHHFRLALLDLVLLSTIRHPGMSMVLNVKSEIAAMLQHNQLQSAARSPISLLSFHFKRTCLQLQQSDLFKQAFIPLFHPARIARERGTMSARDREASDVWWFMAGVSEEKKPRVIPEFGPRTRNRPTGAFIACRECVAYAALHLLI